MKRLTVAISPLLLILAGCSSNRSGPAASAILEARSGAALTGTARFTQMKDGAVKVRLDVTGVTPGVHAFHIHEKGDCSAADATSAGGHFNPTSAPHAAPASSSHHAGDFGNVTADSGGEIHEEFTTRSITVTDGSISVIGKAAVLHADPDDMTTQPSGNAGKRIGCGVVSLAGAM